MSIGVGAVDNLVEAASAGDQDAFRELFHLFHPRVWRAVYARLGNRADADDAAADTFVRLHRALPRYRRRPGSSFDAFVFRIADRAAIDVHRRRHRHRSVPLDDDGGPATTPPEPAGDAVLAGAFAKLGPAEREVLVLRVIEGRSAEEVAELTGRSPGAVRVAQHRALGRLRSMLGEASRGT